MTNSSSLAFLNAWCAKYSDFAEVYHRVRSSRRQGRWIVDNGRQEEKYFIVDKSMTSHDQHQPDDAMDEKLIQECITEYLSQANWQQVFHQLKTNLMLPERHAIRMALFLFTVMSVNYWIVSAYALYVFRKLSAKVNGRFSLIQVAIVIWDTVKLASLLQLGFIGASKRGTRIVLRNWFCLIRPLSRLTFGKAARITGNTAEFGSYALLIGCCLDRIQSIKHPVPYKNINRGRRLLQLCLTSFVVGFLMSVAFDAITVQTFGLRKPTTSEKPKAEEMEEETYYAIPQRAEDAICFQRFRFLHRCSSLSNNRNLRQRNWLFAQQSIEDDGCYTHTPLHQSVATLNGSKAELGLSAAAADACIPPPLCTVRHQTPSWMIPTYTAVLVGPIILCLLNVYLIGEFRSMQKTRHTNTGGGYSSMSSMSAAHRKKQWEDRAHERSMLTSLIVESGSAVLKGILGVWCWSSVNWSRPGKQSVTCPSYELAVVFNQCVTLLVLIYTSRTFRREFLRPFDQFLLPKKLVFCQNGGGSELFRVGLCFIVYNIFMNVIPAILILTFAY